MIPLYLTLSGFLSYREPVEIDFSSFELACIAGANGAGKSSLLDAITWSLFGVARKRDDSLINAQSDAALAALTFAYEGNTYRVQRSLVRRKTTVLEFHILQNGNPKTGKATTEAGKQDEIGPWKPLTERTLRETQERIEKTLRMNYETFVNASFFLQGKADQFTQQRPGDRKRILGSILDLDIWESYRQVAVERRKVVESEITILNGRLQEIRAEMEEGPRRKARLKELNRELESLSRLRLAKEDSLETIRKSAAQMSEQRKLVETLKHQFDSTTRQVDEWKKRLTQRNDERERYQVIVSRSDQIEKAYAAWQQARHDLEYWDEISTRFRESEKLRQPFLDEINAARIQLEEEQKAFIQRKASIAATWIETESLQAQAIATQQAIDSAHQQRDLRLKLEEEREGARQGQADATAENPRLKASMEELKNRIQQLESTEGALCPLCGQPLSSEDRQRLIDELSGEGKEMGDRFRANQSRLLEIKQTLADLDGQIAGLSKTDDVLLTLAQTLTKLEARIEQYEEERKAWETEGVPRLEEINMQLDEGAYAIEATARLDGVNAQLKEIGYDAAAHDAARVAEMEGRTAEHELRQLEKAQAALAPIEREICDLEAQVDRLKADIIQQQDAHNTAWLALQEAEAQLPDQEAAEREMLDIQEQENRLRLEVGAAQQKVEVLKDLKIRRQGWESHKEALAQQVTEYKQLERAFGKDGVPALLIEQALPQIEAKANDILDRLSGGDMSVRFVTQAAYKDKRREDMRETLDIQISDSAGSRDYEMFSGGEAFRVNFAIRLALSEVLAQRAGARLQTLVIDEGFGSQDTLGRQRLVEAINLVRQDFSKILVITHIDDLKDAFPNRIEVEKTERGSSVRVT